MAPGTRGRGHLPGPTPSRAQGMRLAPRILSATGRKPPRALVIAAVGWPRALLLPGQLKTPVRGSLPLPSDCSGLTTGPHTQGEGPQPYPADPGDLEETLDPSWSRRGQETNQVADSKRDEGRGAAGSRFTGRRASARTTTDTQTLEGRR